MLKLRGMAGLLLLTLGVVVAATACGQEEPTATAVPTATSTPVPGATPTSTPEPPSAEELFQVEWDQLIADAQADGELVMILGSSGSRTDRDIFEAFGQKFGLTVIQSTGSGTDNTNKVPNPLLFRRRVNPRGQTRARSRHVDDDGTGGERLQRAALAEMHLLDIIGIADDRDRHLGAVGRRGGRVGPAGAPFQQRRGTPHGASMNHQFVPGIQQMPGHGFAHHPGPDEGDTPWRR